MLHEAVLAAAIAWGCAAGDKATLQNASYHQKNASYHQKKFFLVACRSVRSCSYCSREEAGAQRVCNSQTYLAAGSARALGAAGNELRMVLQLPAHS